MVERIDEYLNILELQRSIRERNFKSFSLIKQWTNFIKHPKAFMLVHHPTYIFEGFEIAEFSWKFKEDINKYNVIINNDFVKEYYSGSDKNKKLYDLLIKKDDVLVILPNPVKLIYDFCNAQKYFVELLSNNKILLEILNEKATKYFKDKDLSLLD